MESPLLNAESDVQLPADGLGHPSAGIDTDAQIPTARWRVASGDPIIEKALMDRLGLRFIQARLLANRGIRTVEEAETFLNPSRRQLISPFLFRDMKRVLARIRQAIERREKIYIFGDRDVDGVSGTAILILTLKSLGADVDCHIPLGGEGYGVHPDIMAKAIRDGFTLGITVDTGICEIDRADQARSGGMDFIVTDHHQQKDTLPNALAILHPGIAGETYPFPHLSGAGVAFKLALALIASRSADPERAIESSTVELDVFHDRLVPLAALAAVADMMPLLGENRVLVSEGLRLMRDRQSSVGLASLLEQIHLAAPTGKDIAFSLGPLLNAPGRLGDATPALRLLTTPSPSEARTLAADIIRQNTERKELVKTNYRRLFDQVREQNDLRTDKILCIAAEGVPHGVTGIVATRIKNEIGRPVMIVLVEDGRGVGTGRSIEALDLVDAVGDCSDLLEKFGGHHQACGVTVQPDRIPVFFERLKAAVAKRVDGMPHPVLDLEAELCLDDLTLDTLQDISILEPFGKGNPFPKFAITDAPVAEIRRIGDAGQHLRLRIGPEPRKAVTAVSWNQGPRADGVRRRMDLAFEMARNDWRGRSEIQLILEDLRLAQGEEPDESGH